AALASAEADLTTAVALHDLARDRERSGVSPEIDTLRARVEAQTSQQMVTDARHARDKQRIALLRIVGLPLGQSIALTSRLPYQSIPAPVVQEALGRALEARADYKAAVAQVHAAELAKRAAVLEHAPTVVFNGDVGALG